MGVLETGKDGSSFVFLPVSDEHGALTRRRHGCGWVGDGEVRGLENIVCIESEPLGLYGDAELQIGTRALLVTVKETDTASGYEQRGTNSPSPLDQEPCCDTYLYIAYLGAAKETGTPGSRSGYEQSDTKTPRLDQEPCCDTWERRKNRCGQADTNKAIQTAHPT